MFEFIRNNQQANRFIYYGTPGANSASWYVFTKPPGINFINMVLIGGGGGGGAGRSGSSNQSRQGGTGGGSGTITVATFLASTLPDSFYVSPGCGGAGGAVLPGANAGFAGISGNASIVSVGPYNTNTGLVIAHAFGGPGGNGGLTAAGPTPLSSGSNTFNMPLINLALTYNTFDGIAGRNTGGLTNGVEVAILTTAIPTITGGGGGGPASTTTGYLGQGYANTAFTPNSSSLPVGTAGKSASFIYSMKPLICVGGAGGSGNVTATASNGGDAPFGAGGGGGGGGVTAGAGGNGGPGLIIINCF